MNSKDDFYVVLPSNVPSTIQNIPSKYLTTFDNPIYLDGEWEVALAEINFKNSIRTIHKSDQIEAKKIVKTVKAPIENAPLIAKIPFVEMANDFDIFTPDGYKPTKFKVLEKDEAIIQDEGGNIIIGYRRTKNNYYIQNKTKHWVNITLPKYLAQIINFAPLEGKKFIYDETPIKIENLQYGFNHAQLKNMNTQLGLFPYEPIDPKVKTIVPKISIEHHVLNSSMQFVMTSPRPGTYASGKDLETELNKNTQFTELFKFHYDTHLNRFELKTVNFNPVNEQTISFKNGIHDVLGFSQTEYTARKEDYAADLVVNLTRGINSMFVYCDLCQPIRVGNTLAPLLRNIAFNTSTYGEQVSITYDRLIYIPVTKTFIDSIQIHLCDSIGETIPFVEGLTNCILHFKRL